MTRKAAKAKEPSVDGSDEEGDESADVDAAAETEVNSKIVKASTTSEFSLKALTRAGAKILKAKLCRSSRSDGLAFCVLLNDEGALLVRRSDQETTARCRFQGNARIVSADLSENGKVAAVLTEGNIVYVVSLETWPTLNILYAVHASSSSDSSATMKGTSFFCLSPSGRRLAVHSTDAPLFVWELQNGDGGDQAARTIASCQGASRGTNVEATSMRFDMHENILVVGFTGSYMARMRVFEGCIYNTEVSEPLPSTPSASLLAPKAYLRGHEAVVKDIAIGPSGQVASCSADSKGFVWITPEYKCGMFLLHPSWCQVQHVLLLSDGVHIVTAASDGFIRIWGAFPTFPRDARGTVPILLKLAPAVEVCRLGAHMVHLAYEQDTCSLVTVWACDSGAPSIPEPIADAQEVGHNFVPADLTAITELQANKKRKLEAFAAAAGVRKDGAASHEQIKDEPHPLHIVVRYENIPLLARRYRSDVTVILHLLARNYELGSPGTRKFAAGVLKYLR